MATEIYFMRHAESLDNVAGVTFDQMDINEEGFLDNPLSELGQRQAEAAADWVSANLKVDAIVSSGLMRTNMTAEPIAERLGMKIDILPEMKEVEVQKSTLGKLEVENTLSRTLYKIPGGEKIRSFFMDAGVAVAFNVWAGFGLKGFEAPSDLRGRARYSLETLAARPERRILAVAHNFFLNAMFLELISISPLNAVNAPKPIGLLPNCSVSCVIAHPPRYRLRYAGRKTSDIT